jgi:hypothetical protein
MTSPYPAPVTPAAMARLTPPEQHAFTEAKSYVARDQKPPAHIIAALVDTVHRLITDPLPDIPEAMTGVELVRAERLRQVAVKGFGAEHDARQVHGELLAAAARWLHAAGWPCARPAYESGEVITSLVKVGALVCAEIDRIVAQEASRGQ